VAHLRPRITHLANIPQLAVGSIPNLPRPRVFGKRVGLNPPSSVLTSVLSTISAIGRNQLFADSPANDCFWR
jgi:hypothetical protein